jgi:putative hemin transport protein
MPRPNAEAIVDLRTRWQALQRKSPETRMRDAAAELGVSEAELISLGCQEKRTIRLRPAWPEILSRASRFGEVMARTRNDVAVHERKGQFGPVELFGPDQDLGQVLGPEIDLRLFFSAWKIGYAVTDRRPDCTLCSLQFFDAAGNAVHQIYLEGGRSDFSAFEGIVADFADENQAPGESVTRKVGAERGPTPKVDVSAFRADWDRLNHPHEFHDLIRRHGLSRVEALQIGGLPRAREVDWGAPLQVLQQAAAVGLPIMVFVGSGGCIQIHTGPVSNIRVIEGEVNVLDARFRFHLRQDLLASVWVVRKPNRGRIVTSVEAYNSHGKNVALFFGRRLPEQEEAREWRDLISWLEP